MDGESETSYDFDAPMFVDFADRGQLNLDDSDIDKWFDERDGDDGGFATDSLEEDNVHNDESTQLKDSEQQVPNEAKDEEIGKENGNATIEQTSEKIDEGKKPSPMFFFEDKSAPNLTVVPSWKPRLQALRQIVNTSSASAKDNEEPPTKKKRPEPARPQVNTSIKSSSAPRRSIRVTPNQSDSRSAPSNTKRPVRAKPIPKMKAPMLTIASTPKMMKRLKNLQSSSTAIKAKEEIELEKIAQMRKDLKEKRKHNEEFMKKALSAANYMPYRSAEDNLTQAHEFHFELDKRIKKPQSNQSEGKEKNFFDTLRQHPVSPSFKNRKITKQQPFSFDNNQSKKRKIMDEEVSSCDGYVSMAQHCYKFQNSTPPRFRTTHAKEQNIGPSKITDNEKTKITCPKTPNLSTRERNRPLPDDCLSRDQQEERDIEEMRNYKFKAREFDQKIVEKQGTYGLKPQPHKTLTEPKPFSLASDERSTAHKSKETEVEEKPAPFKAQPVPEFDKKIFKPELQHQATKIAPFSFHQRDKEMTVKKEEKIQAVLEEEKKAREFHAQPLQNFSPVELSSLSKPNTKFELFSFQAENRGAHKAEMWAKKVEEELNEQRKRVAFKAHSSNVLYQAPFVPKKSLKPNTNFEEFNLNSERRAEERAIYEMKKKEKEMLDEELLAQREAEEEEEERRNVAMLRKQLVHKANPIRTYKHVNIGGSEKPLTQPESPAWNSREKKVLRI